MSWRGGGVGAVRLGVGAVSFLHLVARANLSRQGRGGLWGEGGRGQVPAAAAVSTAVDKSCSVRPDRVHYLNINQNVVWKLWVLHEGAPVRFSAFTPCDRVTAGSARRASITDLTVASYFVHT